MDEKTNERYTKLIQTLDQQVKVYRALLDTVRKEKDILISADLDELNENNKTKEAMLIKLRSLEGLRIEYAAKLAESFKLDVENPRLLELANHLSGNEAERLRNVHSVLTLLLKRVQEFNLQNEVLVQSALANITGAMKAVRDTLQTKSTYARKGEMADGTPGEGGQLVSREA